MLERKLYANYLKIFFKFSGRRFILVFTLSLLILTARTTFSQTRKPVNTIIDLPAERENLDVFHQWIRWNNPGSSLIHHLTGQALDYYEIRDKEIAGLNSKSDWTERQLEVREKLMDIVGPFPERTPLNPKITGIIKKDGYRIEKIVFEAMPRYYVTGCLYVPEGIKGKIPAILNVIGHNQEAFRAPLYQVINYNLVKKGMIVFAIDPPGQGEHVQYFDPETNTSSVGYSVIEHIYFGNQCFLNGISCARYFIWEGIRAIDYLLKRKEVDPERIGVTGFSGGGTITSYISAFDERVKVSVPCSWATANRSQLDIKGVQDSESDFFHGVSKGITFEDLLEVRAPKPTLLTFTSRDEYLTIQGPLEAYEEAKKAYKALGHEDNLQMADDDSKHWMTPKIRLAIYSFFMKHFNLSGSPEETEAEILTEKELTVTPTGQILTSYGGEMIFDVNRKESIVLIENLEKSRKDPEKHLENLKPTAMSISGFIAPESHDRKAFLNGRYQREGYSVSKYAIIGEGNYAIPILLFIPADIKDKHPAIIYLHPQGKAVEAKAGGEIEKLVKEGYVVAAVDVPGIGEVKNMIANGQGKSDAGYTALVIGRSVIGLQAGDIIRVMNYLKTRNEIDQAKIGIMGKDKMCLPALHAAAFDPSVNNIILSGSPVSYRSIVMNRIYKIGLTTIEQGGKHYPFEVDFEWGIAGVLKGYDLPDLLASIAPRKIALIDPKDHALETAPAELINEDMAFPRSVFSGMGCPDHFRIIPASEYSNAIIDWCFK